MPRWLPLQLPQRAFEVAADQVHVELAKCKTAAEPLSLLADQDLVLGALQALSCAGRELQLLSLPPCCDQAKGRHGATFHSTDCAQLSLRKGQTLAPQGCLQDCFCLECCLHSGPQSHCHPVHRKGTLPASKGTFSSTHHRTGGCLVFDWGVISEKPSLAGGLDPWSNHWSPPATVLSRHSSTAWCLWLNRITLSTC